MCSLILKNKQGLKKTEFILIKIYENSKINK